MLTHLGRFRRIQGFTLLLAKNVTVSAISDGSPSRVLSVQHMNLALASSLVGSAFAFLAHRPENSRQVVHAWITCR